METALWSVVGLVLVFGYCVSVASCMIDGPSPSSWWEPFVMGAVFPFFWLYEKRWAIGSVGLMLLVLIAAGFCVWLMGRFFEITGYFFDLVRERVL